jgi:6-methylsalicylate decarboxylase
VRIDAHVHVAPAEYAEVIGRLEGAAAMPDFSLARARAFMERYEIDAAVISTGPPGVYFGDQPAASALAAVLNERYAEIVAAEPGRFAALGVLPLPDVDAALGELAHALDELRLDGVWLPSNVAGTYLGDPEFAPLFDELERRAAYVFVHPGFPPYAPPTARWPVWLIELPFETTRAIVNLLYSGTFDRCPSVRFQFAHLGGTAPFLAERIASLVAREPHFRAGIAQDPLAYLGGLWYDTGLSNALPGLVSVREVAPLERILFGTDWPYAALPEGGGDPAPALAALGGDRRLVDGVNIGALVPRLRSREER